MVLNLHSDICFSVFYFFIIRKNRALTSKGIEPLFSLEKLSKINQDFINESQFMGWQNQASDTLIVFFQGILIVCMVKNTSFPFYYIQLLGSYKGVT